MKALLSFDVTNALELIVCALEQRQSTRLSRRVDGINTLHLSDTRCQGRPEGLETLGDIGGIDGLDREAKANLA